MSACEILFNCENNGVEGLLLICIKLLIFLILQHLLHIRHILQLCLNQRITLQPASVQGVLRELVAHKGLIKVSEKRIDQKQLIIIM